MVRKPSNSAHSSGRKTCTLAWGSYTWKVFATDADNNKQCTVGKQTLVLN